MRVTEWMGRQRRNRNKGEWDMNDTSAGVDPKLLEILVCPVTKEPLVYEAAAQ